MYSPSCLDQRLVLLALKDLQVHDDDLKQDDRQCGLRRGDGRLDSTGVLTTNASDPGLTYVTVENVGMH